MSEYNIIHNTQTDNNNYNTKKNKKTYYHSTNLQHPRRTHYPSNSSSNSPRSFITSNWNQYQSQNQYPSQNNNDNHNNTKRTSSPSSSSTNSSWHGSNSRRISRKRSLNDALSINGHDGNFNHKAIKYGMNSTPNNNNNNNNHGLLTGLQAYQKEEKIGEGTYGIVHRAKDKRTGEYVALKRVKTGLSKNEKKTGFPITSIREIKILQNLDHENIVRLREVVRSSNVGFVFLVFEYFEHDLATLMDKQQRLMGNYFSISEVKCIMIQILSAVEYAHKHFVIHRDIKLSNILFSNNGQIVLCDWGLARLFSNPLKQHTSKVVTLWYRAPELLFGSNKYHTAIDMWAIGCIIGELLKHQPLIKGQNEIEQIKLIYQLLGAPNHHIWPNYNQLPNIINGMFKDIENKRHKYKYNQIDSMFSQFGIQCLDLIKQLLAYDPSKRITAKLALKHSFFEQDPKPAAKDMMPTFPVTK